MRSVIIYLVLIALIFYWQRSPGHNPSVEAITAGIDKKGDTTFSVRLYGLDISVFQGDEIEFLNSRQDTFTFIICRATIGITDVDADFKNNWSLIAQKGFIRGAYHVYECDDDPQLQAEHFLSAVDSLSPNDLPLILDLEQKGLAGITDVTRIRNDLLVFLNLVETNTGKTPMIYVSPDFANTYLNDSAFAKYPLWVADYNGQDEPQVPATWTATGWTFWQRTDTVTVNGVTTDFDVFNGNQRELQSFIHK